MASPKQVELFNRLTDEKELKPGADPASIKAQFAVLSDKNASKWIETMLGRPEKGEVAPDF